MLVHQTVCYNGRSPIDLPFGNPTWQWKISFFGGWNGTTSLHGGCPWKCSIAMFDCRRIYPWILHQYSMKYLPGKFHEIHTLYPFVRRLLSIPLCQKQLASIEGPCGELPGRSERLDGWEMLYHNGPVRKSSYQNAAGNVLRHIISINFCGRINIIWLGVFWGVLRI